MEADGGAAALPALVSVETINFYDQNDTITLTASAQASVTTVNMIRGDGGIVNVGANVATIGLTDITVAATDTTTDDIILNFDAIQV